MTFDPAFGSYRPSWDGPNAGDKPRVQHRCTSEGHFLPVVRATLATMGHITCDCGELTSLATQMKDAPAEIDRVAAVMDSIEDYADAPSATAGTPVIRTTSVEDGPPLPVTNRGGYIDLATGDVVPAICTCSHPLTQHDRTSRKMCHAPICTCDRFQQWHGLTQESGADR